MPDNGPRDGEHSIAGLAGQVLAVPAASWPEVRGSALLLAVDSQPEDRVYRAMLRLAWRRGSGLRLQRAMYRFLRNCKRDRNWAVHW